MAYIIVIPLLVILTLWARRQVAIMTKTLYLVEHTGDNGEASLSILSHTSLKDLTENGEKPFRLLANSPDFDKITASYKKLSEGK